MTLEHKRKPEDTAEKQQHSKKAYGLEAEQQQELQQPELQEEAATEEQPLTDTIRLGLLNLHSQEDTVQHKIDELMVTGIQFLDNLKANFLQRMEKVKRELSGYCEGQAREWEQSSLEILQAQERLAGAHALVQRLGLKASGPTESEEAEPAAAL